LALINQEWDLCLFGTILRVPYEKLAAISVEYIRESGHRRAEMVMWLIIVVRLNHQVNEIHRHYQCACSNTGGWPSDIRKMLNEKG